MIAIILSRASWLLFTTLNHDISVAVTLDKAHRADHSGQCVFYRPDPLISGHGGCHLYLWCPVLCRLFGFAALPDKQGVPRLAICRQHKATMPETVAMSQVAIADGLPVVQFMGPLRGP